MRLRGLSPKARFVLIALLTATVLFAVWPAVSDGIARFVSVVGSQLRYLVGADGIDLLGEKDSLALIPMLAVIVASQGHTWERKAAYACAGVGLFLTIDALAIAFDLVTPPPVGHAGPLADAVFALLDFALPIAVLIMFTGAEPATLWTQPARRHMVTARCPFCKRRQTDLEVHVQSVHGLSALSDKRVRRLLEEH